MKEINSLNELENTIGFKKINKFFTEYSMLELEKYWIAILTLFLI